MKVKLIGLHGCVDTVGHIEDLKLSKISILKRNNNYYVFSRIEDNVVIFMESLQPCIITEF